jgi:hypothetical protein
MTAPVEPVPTLELPSAALMQWSQMALLLAGQLAARREQLDRLSPGRMPNTRPGPMTSSSCGSRPSPRCAP